MSLSDRDGDLSDLQSLNEVQIMQRIEELNKQVKSEHRLFMIGSAFMGAHQVAMQKNNNIKEMYEQVDPEFLYNLVDRIFTENYMQMPLVESERRIMIEAMAIINNIVVLSERLKEMRDSLQKEIERVE